MTDALKEFRFLSWLTAIVVIGYVGISGYAFIRDEVSWQDFSGAVGPIAGLLLGYWVRGEQK